MKKVVNKYGGNGACVGCAVQGSCAIDVIILKQTLGGDSIYAESVGGFTS